MQRRSTSTVSDANVGPNIVRAWFDTVINPLLGFLEQEVSWLAQENWTWRFKPPALELICPVRRYLDREAYPNLEQFQQLQPSFARLAGQHDQLVEKLTQAAQRLHEKIGGDPDLRSEISVAISLAGFKNLGVSSVTEIFGAYPASEHVNLVAQYLVNHLGDLPAHYATSTLWNAKRHQFMKVLERPGVRELDIQAKRAAAQLAAASKELIELLKEIRLTLSLKHDVPPSSAGSLTGGVRIQ